MKWHTIYLVFELRRQEPFLLRGASFRRENSGCQGVSVGNRWREREREKFFEKSCWKVDLMAWNYVRPAAAEGDDQTQTLTGDQEGEVSKLTLRHVRGNLSSFSPKCTFSFGGKMTTKRRDSFSSPSIGGPSRARGKKEGSLDRAAFSQARFLFFSFGHLGYS